MNFEDLHAITHWGQVVQLRDDGLLAPAELTLLEAAKTGEAAQISGSVPNHKAPGVLIRSALLRYLILGGCKDFTTQPSGITINGAWISGPLDLSFTSTKGPVDLFNCHLPERPAMVQMQADGLALVGCTLAQGLSASRVQIAGNVTLNRTRSDGKISLSGGEIRGHLSCTEAVLNNPGNAALKAQGVSISSSVLLGGTRSDGLISFLGSRIGGQVVCNGAALRNPNDLALNMQSTIVQGDVMLRGASTEGEVSFLGAEIHGVLDCGHSELRGGQGRALNAQRLVVKEGFIWRRVKEISGAVDLTSAHVGDLWDDPDSWDKCDRLLLPGFRYDVLQGTIDADDRMAWLKKGAISAREFYPQPYEHLAKLLRETGHRTHARAIMIAKEREQRKSARVRWRRERVWRRKLVEASRLKGGDRQARIADLRQERPNDEHLERLALLHPKGSEPGFIDPMTLRYAQADFRLTQRWFNMRQQLRHGTSLVADRIFGVVVGYGHRPERSFYVLLALVICGWILAAKAWEAGDFAPTLGPVLMSDSWQVLATDPAVANPAAVWSAKYKPDGVTLTAGRDYETFNALTYAVDTVVPIVSLGQEAAWAPSTTRGPWGQWLWWVRWLLISLGWIVTAIGAAAVTGVIRRD